MCQDAEDKKVSVQEFDTVRSKVFNFYSFRSVIIEDENKNSQKGDTCKYKIDTGSDGNLMPIRKYKLLFPHTNLNELNTSINRKIVLHPYNNLSIPNMGRVALINKGIKYQCIFPL